ncbi:metallophosphoesterase [Dyadobacter aurulentus]|uniref:metallophosphoesterase n=1 Tax=Dyadobacter sp. UC 10 TaxID=2605428 RepID=UPI0011F1C0FF|nr:metallophosphoesterase [Dyadobacter sp. UC 10]KAA0993368.1 hypothetical protein FXO21_25920 [Dyadobacter sp. UC 10]
MKKGSLNVMAVLLLLSTAAFAQKKDFSIAIIPDTQYYTEESRGGKNAFFVAQTEWIVANQEKENIAYVIHVGDVVDKGDSKPEQWVNAKNAMYVLENPLPGMPYGVPYGVAVGNHDQSPSQFALTGNTFHFNKYFGVDHFQGRPYYGGHFGKDNDCHYDLFSASGTDFIVIYIEYDSYDTFPCTQIIVFPKNKRFLDTPIQCQKLAQVISTFIQIRKRVSFFL